MTSTKICNRCIVVILFFLIVAGISKVKAAEDISLYSETAILMDANTGEVLFNQNMEKTMYPASITKIVTAIIAIEQGHLDDIVTVSKKATEVTGTRVYLVEDEKVSLLKLVQGLLINSGNDAGTAIAEHMAGSETFFAKKMNQFIEEKIGVSDTHFTNPHGLFDEDHTTTAYDMAKITQYAMNNETFREIVGTKEMEWVGEEWETTIYNHNRLLWDYEGTTGVKNGFVNKSGYTLVTTAKRNDMKLIAVTLNAPSAEHAYHDMKTLFDYGFDHYKTNVLFSHKVFETENGTKYKLDKDLYFVTGNDEDVSITVNRLGRLWIRGENDRVIRSELLSPVESAQLTLEKTVVEDQKTEESSNFIRWISRLWSLLPFWI
jgi:D-alanyl-D-alanine carboxypeptidase/D-alanyl-D-alanine carboxypeptidase (penicillin-binding protein 5/6)